MQGETTKLRKITIEFEMEIDSVEGVIRETITDTHPDNDRRYLHLKCSSLIEELDRVKAENPDLYREFMNDSDAFVLLKRQLLKQKNMAAQAAGLLH